MGSMNIDRVIARVKYFVENLDKLIVKQIDPVKKPSSLVLFLRLYRHTTIYAVETKMHPFLQGCIHYFKLSPAIIFLWYPAQELNLQPLVPETNALSN